MGDQTRGAHISGLGTYVPDRVLTNADLARIVDTTDEWIVEHTGIRERRVAADDQATSDLGLEAAKRAIADAGVAPEEIDLVICATVTPDMAFPATACLIQGQLGIPKAGAFDLISGCTGWVQGLVTGAQFIQSGSCQHALIIGADTLCRITDWTDRSSCILFGDGACAAVLSPCEPGGGLLGYAMESFGQHSGYLTQPAGGSRLRLTPELLAMHQDCIHMQGHDVFKLAVRGCQDIAAEALKNAGLEPDDVDIWVPHQANVRIIDAAARRYNVPDEKILINLSRYGNTSAASIGLALDEYKLDHGIADGAVMMFMSFGAGFSLAAAIFRWIGK